jgi:hypothetical protein
MTEFDIPKTKVSVESVVMATDGRVHARIGALKAQDLSIHDGQR